MVPATPDPRVPGHDDPQTELAAVLVGQELVRDATRRLLHVGDDELDPVIDDALAGLGRHLDVDRTYLFTVADTEMSNTHEWCAPGIPSELAANVRHPTAVLARWFEPLQLGEPVELADVDDLPADDPFRAVLQAQGVRSVLMVPMVSAGELVGFVGSDAVRTARRFTRFEIGLLRALADVMTSVIVRRRSDAKAAVAEQRLAALTRYATDFILIVGGDERIRFASGSWASVGLDPDELVDTRWADHVHPVDVGAIRRLIQPIVDEQLAERVIRLPDFRVLTSDGDVRWFAGSVSDVRHDGIVDGLVVNAHDVTDRRDIQEQLARDALHDPLTGLGNRALLTEQLARACRRAERNRTSVGVVFLDLDRFKLVNDGHGHAVGDEVLVEVGRRLAQVVREDDVVARFGGDEFVVMLDGFDDPSEVGSLVVRLERALDPPVDVGGNSYRVTASMGVVLGTGAGLDPVAMLRDADTAMYRAKETGRDRVVVFDETLRTKVLRRLTLMHRLPAALETGAIELAVQPVVDVRTGELVGGEALARWFDPDLGAVAPSEFIPVSEETGTTARLTERVIDAALAAVAGWPCGLEIAVNLSLSQLVDPALIGLVERLLARHGVAGSRLCVEVTESSLMRRPDEVAAVLRELRGIGLRTALDDFGTGYSSLAMLRELPIDVLKIDRAFVRGVHRDPRDRRLVDAVIGLARDFGMVTLAEGVETPEQRRILVEAGCSLAQGYLFGRPVPIDGFAATLRAGAAANPVQSMNPASRSQVVATTSASSSSMS